MNLETHPVWPADRLDPDGSLPRPSPPGQAAAAPRRMHAVVGRCWEKLAQGRPDFGNPARFNRCIAQRVWQTFTVTLKSPAFFDAMQTFSDNAAGTGGLVTFKGGLVTFKDCNWLMSIMLAHQPHFAAPPADMQVVWGYALLADRIGDFVAKTIADCTGAEVLHELAGHHSRNVLAQSMLWHPARSGIGRLPQFAQAGQSA